MNLGLDQVWKFVYIKIVMYVLLLARHCKIMASFIMGSYENDGHTIFIVHDTAATSIIEEVSGRWKHLTPRIVAI